MSEKKVVKPVALAVGAALAGTFALSGAVNADADTTVSPFSLSTLSAGHMHGTGEGSCGEGSCGEDSNDNAEGDADGEGSCGEGSCGGDSAEGGDADAEGSCGGDADAEGSCGEGSCGSDDS